VVETFELPANSFEHLLILPPLLNHRFNLNVILEQRSDIRAMQTLSSGLVVDAQEESAIVDDLRVGQVTRSHETTPENDGEQLRQSSVEVEGYLGWIVEQLRECVQDVVHCD
jgi:hypothetical protein